MIVLLKRFAPMKWSVLAAMALFISYPALARPLTSVLPEPLVAADVPVGKIVPDVLRCLRDRNTTLVSAHRGGWGPGYPENAIETLAHTLSRGPLIIEIDIRRTADGVLVVLHDDTLERTTTGTGAVSELMMEEISNLQLVDTEGTVTDFRIPLLSEVLEWARGRALLQLDVKSSVPVEEVVAAVAEHDAIGYSAVVSYTLEDALRAAAANPRVALSIEITDRERLEALIAAGVAPGRIMAWSGVHPAPVPDIWAMLREADIPVAFGALWYIDTAVLETGDASIYSEIADGGVAVIATDLHWTAYDGLATRQDTLAAYRACLSP